MHALVEGGADVIELGVPFSDPMADGPVIQRASERALARGTGLARVLGMVREFRTRDAGTPVVLMGYANPIEAMGVASFAERAALAASTGAGRRLPPRGAGVRRAARRARLAPIFLISPTTPPSRIERWRRSRAATSTTSR